MPVKKPIKRIEDKDIFDFLEKIEELPTKPVSDDCQLIKVKVGNRWRTDCAGGCPKKKKCRHVMGIKGKKIFAECVCK